MNHMQPMTKDEAHMLRAAMRRNDARSIHPELADAEQWKRLDLALDKLRYMLMAIEEGW